MYLDKHTLFVINEPTITATYWYNMTIKGVNEQAAKKGLNVSIVDIQTLEQMPAEYFQEGYPVIVISASINWFNRVYSILQKAGMRSIMIGTGEQSLRRNASIVTLSQEDSTIDIIQYMIQAGRRKTAYFACNPRALADKLKLSGFMAASDIFGLNFSKDDVFLNRGSIEECLQNFSKCMHKYDSVMCANDISAIALIHFAASKGVKIPEDLYVTGFGNIILGQILTPSLTSATLNYYDAGCHAVDSSIYLQRNPNISSQFTVIKCQIIARASTEYKEVKEVKIGLSNLHQYGTQSDNECFFLDSYVSNILKLENLFQNLDDIDKEILQGISEGKTYNLLTESLNISESTLKYHIKKMLQSTGLSSRQELLDMISNLLGKNAISTFLKIYK